MLRFTMFPITYGIFSQFYISKKDVKLLVISMPVSKVKTLGKSFHGTQ